MDFGIMGLDNLVCSNSQASNNGGFSLENGAEADKQKWYGSGFLKPEREEDNDDLRDYKMAKISLQRSDISNFSEGHQQMLSFSSPNSQNVALPYYYQTSNAFTRNTGYGTGGITSSLRGPFTPSQWMELEHQALIYKYITANVPVPSYLLNPIRKALESVAFSTCFSGLRSNPLGWGGFHLGFSNTDPEPGRCRRTDGKKWRCSKDAVPDQKYCEKHINRGRHRSRKPVEAQSGHSANAKSASSISAATSATGASNGLGSLQPGGSNNHPSGIPSINRSLLNKENTNVQYQQTTTILSMASPKVSSPNDHHTSYKESSRSNEFGLVCSDSLLNPLNTSLVNFTNYDHPHNLNNHDQIKSQNALRQFIDDWPKTRPHQSPTNENPKSSPLHISRELEMGLGVGTIIDTEQNQRQQTSWVPISWEPSVGGPLGEVLHNTSNNTSECGNAKALNLMEMLDNSPRLASSPTGVLQKGAFGSLSNSSAGSSPRGECSKTFDGASCSNGLAFGSVSKF